jgi:hypothetical protein
VSRPTATSWLNALAEAGLLQTVKIGRDRLFINREFLQLLGRVSQFSGPYAGVDDCTGQ